ncbi:hypothetical protein QR680_006724 [Steinernema hermaphroditum]|uniref:non-specific serine/threonine protein kinase n=1 Tax=Steinernema hermaphroditum TaxID=289476 RepID=A0AA39HYT9_9BILA|nr:hypothetical protein QR680_006724 [Steinernema hermaphroditum]
MPFKNPEGAAERSKLEDSTMPLSAANSQRRFQEVYSDVGSLPETLQAALFPHLRNCPPGKGIMHIGETLNNRWVIRGLLGSGGYGQIYCAKDRKTRDVVAVKVEPTKRRGKTVRRMILEQRVLMKMQGKPHTPVMYGSGVVGNMNYIVMQVMSANVGDLRKRSPMRRLSITTTARIMMQAIAALKELHLIGYLHRDVKTTNMCFGITEASKHRLLLFDFGLVRRFRTADGKIRKKRDRAGFRGTLRYVSPRVHDREEQGPGDDLLSLFYAMIEMIRREVPWRHLKDHDKIKAAKLHLTVDDFRKVSEYVGEPMQEYGRIVVVMSVYDEPNYGELQSLMKELAGGKELNAPYDWENEYADVVAEVDLNRSLGL